MPLKSQYQQAIYLQAFFPLHSFLEVAWVEVIFFVIKVRIGLCIYCSVFFRCLADTPLPPQLPQPCTVRHLVEWYLDIRCVPRRSFFQLLSYFSLDEQEREKLQEFSSAAGQDELYTYCNRLRRTTLEVRLAWEQQHCFYLFIFAELVIFYPTGICAVVGIS